MVRIARKTKDTWNRLEKSQDGPADQETLKFHTFELDGKGKGGGGNAVSKSNLRFRDVN